MSSSGLIYAFIVGAWAVYLVPMWLRREDELNKARQTQRYTTAIKVLSNKDSFERRHGAAEDREQAAELPLAAGQDGPAPAAGARTLDRVKAKERERAAANAPVGARGAAAGSASAAKARRARTALAAESAAPASRVSAKVQADAVDEADPNVWTPAPRTAASAAHAPGSAGPRSGLRARRRRVVGFLFALTSLGAIVSADLGLGYVWAMLLPAAVLSAYIAWVRKDERARVAERARRHAVAVRTAREAERREQEARRERAEHELAREQAEREELSRRTVAARRRTAAARSRAERRVPASGLPEQGDLPRAANG